MNTRPMFRGNAWFTSIFVQNDNTLSRRDDVISIIYSMIYLLTKYEHVYDSGFIKVATPQQMCQGAECLLPVLEEAYSYHYE